MRQQRQHPALPLASPVFFAYRAGQTDRLPDTHRVNKARPRQQRASHHQRHHEARVVASIILTPLPSLRLREQRRCPWSSTRWWSRSAGAPTAPPTSSTTRPRPRGNLAVSQLCFLSSFLSLPQSFLHLSIPCCRRRYVMKKIRLSKQNDKFQRTAYQEVSYNNHPAYS
jgi:hypothetical protein